LWISPNQVAVLTLNDSVTNYGREITKKFFDAGIRVELNDRNESMGKKAREAQVQRFNYLVTVGEKEMAENKISVRRRDSKDLVEMDIDEFIEKINGEIDSKKL